MTMLTRGADRLLELHAAELPQKDELCGCFWATLALRLNGEGPVEQDDVALVAGSVITSHGSVHLLPRGQKGRNDYRLELPVTDDDAASGTSAHGVALAVSELTDGRLAACPVSGLDASGVRAASACRGRGDGAGGADRERADRRVLGLACERRSACGLPRARRSRRGPCGRLVGRALRRAWSASSEGRAGALVTVADTYPALGPAASTCSRSRPSPRRSRDAACSSSPSRMSRGACAMRPAALAELWDNGSPLPRLSSQPASAG